MILLLVLSQIFVSAASPPLAPGNVEVKDGLLSWTPAMNVSLHSVLWRRFDERVWSDLPQCQRVVDSCDVSAVIQEAPHGCVALSVRAEGDRDQDQGQSEAVEACAAAEDRCTPQVRLSAVPGSASIMVHLMRSHAEGALQKELGDHAKHQVCYWNEDREDEEFCSQSVASLRLTDLEPGQTYCVRVRFWQFSRAEGLPRCPLCLQVPRAPSKHATLALALILPGLGLALGSAAVYVLLFHRDKIKTWFRPEPQPDCFVLPLEGAVLCTPTDEECSPITKVWEIDQD